MRNVCHWILASFLLMVSNETLGQSRNQQLKAKVDSVLSSRYYKTPYDTNYVVRPEGTVTLKLRLNQTRKPTSAPATRPP